MVNFSHLERFVRNSAKTVKTTKVNFGMVCYSLVKDLLTAVELEFKKSSFGLVDK